jgi:cobalt-zinc-cadmium efflux system outer membrane protein
MSHTGIFPILITGALAYALSATTGAQTQAPPIGPLTLDAAIQRALSANPTIAAARLRRTMSLAEVQVARERLNPEARVELERETPTRAYSLAVPIEAGGKRARRIAVSEAAVRTSEAEIARTIAEVRASVRRAYFELVIAASRLELLEDLQGIAVRARDAAQQRFDAGSAPRLEVVQADLALAEAQNQATGARGLVVAARAAFNALLALPADAAIPLASPIDLGPPAVAEAAIVQARAVNTEIAVLDRRLEEQRARIALARSLQQPDVTPEGTLTRGAEPEFSTGWRAAVAVTVPIFTRHRAGVLLEQATLAQLTAERDATLARLTGEVTSAAVLADSQRQQYLRYRDAIIPQALDVERMAEDAYRLGQTGISAFLQALQASRDVRVRSLQAAADFQAALADLERAIGAPLP